MIAVPFVPGVLALAILGVLNLARSLKAFLNTIDLLF